MVTACGLELNETAPSIFHKNQYFCFCCKVHHCTKYRLGISTFAGVSGLVTSLSRSSFCRFSFSSSAAESPTPFSTASFGDLGPFVARSLVPACGWGVFEVRDVTLALSLTLALSTASAPRLLLSRSFATKCPLATDTAWWSLVLGPRGSSVLGGESRLRLESDSLSCCWRNTVILACAGL